MAYFDVLQSFATISEENRYTRPQLNREHIIDIKDGRHPVVEKVLKDTQYVENDCVMPSDLSILLITGPNMSGKSTYMRQLALIAIMVKSDVMCRQVSLMYQSLINFYTYWCS